MARHVSHSIYGMESLQLYIEGYLYINHLVTNCVCHANTHTVQHTHSHQFLQSFQRLPTLHIRVSNFAGVHGNAAYWYACLKPATVCHGNLHIVQAGNYQPIPIIAQCMCTRWAKIGTEMTLHHTRLYDF